MRTCATKWHPSPDTSATSCASRSRTPPNGSSPASGRARRPSSPGSTARSTSRRSSPCTAAYATPARCATASCARPAAPSTRCPSRPRAACRPRRGLVTVWSATRSRSPSGRAPRRSSPRSSPTTTHRRPGSTSTPGCAVLRCSCTATASFGRWRSRATSSRHCVTSPGSPRSGPSRKRSTPTWSRTGTSPIPTPPGCSSPERRSPRSTT